MENVLLLNQDHSFLNTISWQRAMTLLSQNKVEVIKYTDKVVRSERAAVKLPKVVKLLYYIKKVCKVHMAYSRKVVFMRDKHECVYCGSKNELTIDHLHPRTRGGKTEYENVVTCCWDCNNLKGDKSLEQVGWKLRRKPYSPSVSDYLRMKMTKVENVLMNTLYN